MCCRAQKKTDKNVDRFEENVMPEVVNMVINYMKIHQAAREKNLSFKTLRYVI